MSERKKRYSLGTKVTSEMKREIDRRAFESGRTQSQVAEDMIWFAVKMDRWIEEQLANARLK